jgi:hypothetical protein
MATASGASLRQFANPAKGTVTVGGETYAVGLEAATHAEKVLKQGGTLSAVVGGFITWKVKDDDCRIVMGLIRVL